MKNIYKRLNTTIRRHRFSSIGLTVFILIFAAIGGYILLSGHAATPPGASLATCAGGACTEGSLPNPTSRPSSCTTTPTPTGAGVPAGGWVNLGNISDGVQNECRYYAVYIPTGLTGNASVLVYGHGNMGCLDNTDNMTSQGLDQLANNNRLIVVNLLLGWSSSGTSCTTVRPGSAWFHPNADYPDPGSDVPNDYSYIQTVVHDLEARMTGNITVDSQRIWYMGLSSGGGLATGIMCDDATSSLFAGVAWDGVGYNVASTGGSSATPINGTERCGGGSAPVATNKNFVVSWTTSGPGTNGYNGFCAKSFTPGNPSPNGHCVPNWTEANSFLQSHFGCTANPTTVFSGTPNAVNEFQTHSNCISGAGPGVQAISVPGSGDGYSTVDDTLNGAINTNGIVMQDIFDFLVNYGGPSGTTAAPTVTISASPSAIASGSSSTITWNTTNATSCTASGAWSGSKATSGSQLVSPVSTSTYSLLCSGAGGSDTKSSTVTVNSAADTTPPSTPANLAKTGSTTTSISISWAASTDNVGVAGYGLYKNGSSAATTTSTSSTFSGLSCGTSYTLAVDAFDAAANKSAQTSISASTLACAANPPKTGDINGDGHIDIFDLSILLSHYNQAATAAQGDINSDGVCTILDMSILLSNWGK